MNYSNFWAAYSANLNLFFVERDKVLTLHQSMILTLRKVIFFPPCDIICYMQCFYFNKTDYFACSCKISYNSAVPLCFFVNISWCNCHYIINMLLSWNIKQSKKLFIVYSSKEKLYALNDLSFIFLLHLINWDRNQS